MYLNEVSGPTLNATSNIWRDIARIMHKNKFYKWIPSGNTRAGALRPHANKIVLGPWQTRSPQFHELDKEAGFSHPNANMWWAMSAVVKGWMLAILSNWINKRVVYGEANVI